jgi:hypothetical protein
MRVCGGGGRRQESGRTGGHKCADELDGHLFFFFIFFAFFFISKLIDNF